MRCSVQNCSNESKTTSKADGITYHLFPKEPSLRSAWIDVLGSPDYAPNEQSAICSQHFKIEDLYATKLGTRRVKNGAVPVIVFDSSEDLEAPSSLRVCRICLAMDSRLLDIREQNLEQFYLQITGIFVNNDRLPQRVCWECAARLRAAAALREKATRVNTLLHGLTTNTYITVRDIKSINRTKNQLTSRLIHKIYENDDFDLHIKDNVIIKSETNNGFNDDDNDNGFDTDIVDNGFEETKVPVPEIKDENEIFVNEFDDFESDDEKTLSTLSSQVYDLKKEKVKVKKKRKVKKVKEKVKVKVKKSEPVKRRDGEEDPESTMDKYKTSDIRRRKPNDSLDETLFTITTPTYEDQIAEVEKRQESSSYKNALFKCTTCYRGFQIRDRYEAHIVRHSEKCGMYECFICKTRLKAARALRKHITAQHTEQFSCKGCPFVTRNRLSVRRDVALVKYMVRVLRGELHHPAVLAALRLRVPNNYLGARRRPAMLEVPTCRTNLLKGVAREHEKWHAGTKYQCPHCAMEFDKLTTYMGHIRIKHASDWVCPHCGYTFVSRKGVLVHKRKKHRLIDDNTPLEGPTCTVCEVQFASEEAHARHLKLSSRHMTESDPNRLRNDSQSMNAERVGRVMRRIERRPVIHGRGEDECDVARPHVTCEQCGVVLRDLRLYAQHFRRAHPDKNRTKYPAMKTPAMCELCGRIFQSMALLKDHMWVHTGEKRFKCAGCPKSFTQKSNLVFHERVHSEPRPSFPCPLCGKHFAFYNNRRRHMFIHTGLKPFKCNTCGKCFTTAGEQRAHLDHVHMKKPWPKRARKDYDKCHTEP